MKSWNKYFMDICRMVSERSPCLSRHGGAVIVRDKQILSTGYNGPASGESHCTICARKQKPDYKSGTNYNDCPAVHAEMNAIIQAAKHGVSINGATLYCTFIPCVDCLRAIINAGIKEVIFDEWWDINCDSRYDEIKHLVTMTRLDIKIDWKNFNSIDGE